MTVAVEVTGINDFPRSAWIDQVTAVGQNRTPVHLPDNGRAIAVLPKNIGVTVCVKIAGRDSLPRSGHIGVTAGPLTAVPNP